MRRGPGSQELDWGPWSHPAESASTGMSETQRFSEVATEARTAGHAHTGVGGRWDSAPGTRHRVGKRRVGGPVAHPQAALLTAGRNWLLPVDSGSETRGTCFQGDPISLSTCPLAIYLVTSLQTEPSLFPGFPSLSPALLVLQV